MCKFRECTGWIFVQDLNHSLNSTVLLRRCNHSLSLPHSLARCRFITTEQSAHCSLPVVAIYKSTLGAKFVVSNGAMAGLEHKRRRCGLAPHRSVSDEPVTSRHGIVEMSTLAGQLFTKKIVVRNSIPTARSYLFMSGYSL
jgi:hypothetical protein